MPPPARSSTAGPRRRALVLPLLLLSLVLLLLLHLTSSRSPRYLPALRKPSSRSQACDYSAGEWVRDPLAGSSLRYDHTCKEIFKGWNCIANGKTNARDLLGWRWMPAGPGCELHRLDPRRFLERHRDTSIGNFPLPFCCLRKMAEKIDMLCDFGGDKVLWCDRVVFNAIKSGARVPGCVKCGDDAFCMPPSSTMFSTE